MDKWTCPDCATEQSGATCSICWRMYAKLERLWPMLLRRATR